MEQPLLYKRILNKVALAEEVIIGLILLMEIVISVANVFSRYVIHMSWSFVEEVVVASLVLMSTLGAALCARTRGGLINLTLFTGMLPKRKQLVLEIVMCLFLLVFAGAMTYYGTARCIDGRRMGRMTSTLQLPEWNYSSFVPIGGFMLIVHTLERIADCVLELRALGGKEEQA